MEYGKIYTFMKFLIAFDKMTKLILQQISKLSQYLAMILKILLDTLIKQGIIFIKKFLRTRQYSTSHRYQHVFLFFVAQLLCSQLLEQI